MNITIVKGPPGCGKTTYLARQVERALEAGHTFIMFSLTRAARAELENRIDLTEPWRIGTLHAHCFNLLEHPQIAYSKKNIAQWNEKHPSLAVREQRRAQSLEVQSYSEFSALETYDMLRHKLKTIEEMPLDVQQVAYLWEDWKSEAGVLDFTDLIIKAQQDATHAPGTPAIIFGDEVQDMSALEMQLVVSWIKNAQHGVLVGDPDQNLYEWRGSDPNLMNIPDVKEIVLHQSYRVPKRVHSLAVQWIRQVKDRRDAKYNPTAEEGCLRRLSATIYDPAPMIKEIQTLISTPGRTTVMIQTSCKYMLNEILYGMRGAGIPFHNPYRLEEAKWSPLAQRHGVSLTQRASAFERYDAQLGSWNIGDIKLWLQVVKADVTFRYRGAKKDIENLTPATYDPYSFLDTYIKADNDELMDALLGEPIDRWEWLSKNCTSSYQGKFEYAIQVIKHYGTQALQTKPRVMVGTIHSFKGAEANIVYLFPDLSPAGVEQYNGNSNDLAMIIRQFYVAITRARNELVLCEQGGKASVDL